MIKAGFLKMYLVTNKKYQGRGGSGKYKFGMRKRVLSGKGCEEGVQARAISSHTYRIMNRISMIDSKNEIIVFVPQGSITVGFEDRCITVHSGEMFILPANQNYFVEIRDEDSRAISTIFNPNNCLNECLSGLESLRDMELKPDRAPELNLSVLKMNQRIWQYVTLLEGYMSDGNLPDVLIEMKQREFICLLFNYYTKEEVSQFLSSISGEDLGFRKLMEQNYRNVKNVAELASIANYSTSGFIKKFNRIFGCSPQSWISARRASAIQRELFAGKAIKEVAMDNGFCSYEHFCRFCKRHLGLTPAQIRTGTKRQRNIFLR